MTFEEAYAELISEGFTKKEIRRMKVRWSECFDEDHVKKHNFEVEEAKNKLRTKAGQAMSDEEKESYLRQAERFKSLPTEPVYGVSPVWEESADTPALRDTKENFIGNPQIVRYRLDEGSIIEDLGEFWIPCSFDGLKGFRENFCSPHWLRTPEERSAFCLKHYRPTSWPDEGERSQKPIRFINSELSLLRSSNQFKGSSEIPKKHRESAVLKMREQSETAFNYLAEAVERSLKRTEIEPRQVSKKQMESGQVMSDYVNNEAALIIELAYRAGRASATAATYYRGIPAIARAGAPTVFNQGKNQKAPLESLPASDQSAVDYMKKNPERSNADILGDLTTAKVIEYGEVTKKFRWKDSSKWVRREAAMKRIRDLKRRYIQRK